MVLFRRLLSWWLPAPVPRSPPAQDLLHPAPETEPGNRGEAPSISSILPCMFFLLHMIPYMLPYIVIFFYGKFSFSRETI